MMMPAFWILPLALVTLLDGSAWLSGAAQTRPKEIRNSIGIRLVEIPGGSFDMGSTVGPGEAPVHRVAVRSFWMGVTEVTQAQWQAVMGNNPSHFKKGGLDAPVEMVSWDDAQAFVRKLNDRESDWRYRLPSEAEWEYACLAGTAKDPYGPAEAVAWIKENSGGTTHPVGLKQPNAFGLYDMFGNVPEWTAGLLACRTTMAHRPTGAPGKEAAAPITRSAEAVGTFPRSSCTPRFAALTARFIAEDFASRRTADECTHERPGCNRAFSVRLTVVDGRRLELPTSALRTTPKRENKSISVNLLGPQALLEPTLSGHASSRDLLHSPAEPMVTNPVTPTLGPPSATGTARSHWPGPAPLGRVLARTARPCRIEEGSAPSARGALERLLVAHGRRAAAVPRRVSEGNSPKQSR